MDGETASLDRDGVKREFCSGWCSGGWTANLAHSSLLCANGDAIHARTTFELWVCQRDWVLMSLMIMGSAGAGPGGGGHGGGGAHGGGGGFHGGSRGSFGRSFGGGYRGGLSRNYGGRYGGWRGGWGGFGLGLYYRFLPWIMKRCGGAVCPITMRTTPTTSGMAV